MSNSLAKIINFFGGVKPTLSIKPLALVSTTAAIAVMGVVTSTSEAQAASFNIDFGSEFPSTNNAFGAAANQSGPWNNITTLGVTSNLTDVTGATSTVSLDLVAATISGVIGSGGNDIINLISDNFFSNAGNAWSVTLNGLSNGIYDIYYYAPTNTNVQTGSFEVNGVSVAGISGDSSDNDVLDQGLDWDIVSGVSVTDGTLTFNSSSISSFRGLSGLQLTQTQASQSVPEPSSILGLLSLGGLAIKKVAKNSKKK